MRRRIMAVLVLSFACIAQRTAAQERPATGDPMADGLTAGQYLRVSGGMTSPVSPQGSLRDWNRGAGVAVAWESWDTGATGLGRVGFALTAAYSMLPLNEQQLKSDFTSPLTGAPIQSATASKASVLEITTNLRWRIPFWYMMPAINFGFGFINWHPGEIHYRSGTDAGNARQQSRSGAELSIGGSLDKTIYDRWAVFGEAAYVYGYTSFGRGLSTPGGQCVSNGCDVLKNTTLGTMRGGLRVRIGR
jgi:hypothetical protein